MRRMGGNPPAQGTVTETLRLHYRWRNYAGPLAFSGETAFIPFAYRTPWIEGSPATQACRRLRAFLAADQKGGHCGRWSS